MEKVRDVCLCHGRMVGRVVMAVVTNAVASTRSCTKRGMRQEGRILKTLGGE